MIPTVEITTTVQRTILEIAPGQEVVLEVSQPSIVIESVGAQGAQGPAGPASAFFDYTQAAPSALWTVAHNLGFRPTVSVRTSGGLEVIADIQHLSVNTLTISLVEPMAGAARLT